MTKSEQQAFIQNLIDNTDVILNEYKQTIGKKTIAIPGYDEASTPLEDWRAIALWWDYKAWRAYQKWCPITTELVRNGPDHRATGWLILTPQASTPAHCHLDWGDKIIFHLPMIIPEGDVGFSVGGKIHRWKVGEPFAFDITKEHFGFNHTDETRVIFVLDFDRNVWGETLKPYMTLEN
jgi:aspartyl/asparaginyl beta-hydroxylase (cupin superfamily)